MTPKAAQKLLADAGYPNGFEVDFACSAGRYINDEQLCQAITSQWAKVGVKAKLRSLPFATYFPMIQRNEASIYLLGWGVPTFDAFYSLQSLVRSPGAGGDGNFNLGRFSDPQMDALIERIKKETDATTRNQLIEQALIKEHELVSHIPAVQPGDSLGGLEEGGDHPPRGQPHRLALPEGELSDNP